MLLKGLTPKLWRDREIDSQRERETEREREREGEREREREREREGREGETGGVTKVLCNNASLRGPGS